jgi:hypothetical protein
VIDLLIQAGLAIGKGVSNIYDSKVKKDIRKRETEEAYRAIYEEGTDRESVGGISSPQWKSEWSKSKAESMKALSKQYGSDVRAALFGIGTDFFGSSAGKKLFK